MQKSRWAPKSEEAETSTKPAANATQESAPAPVEAPHTAPVRAHYS
jgi:hypothetical protein